MNTKQKQITMKGMRLRYPCIIEVSMDKDFNPEQGMLPNKVQVCIGRVDKRYVCVKSKEEHVDWMLDQVKQAVRSGGLSTELTFWNYARLATARG